MSMIKLFLVASILAITSMAHAAGPSYETVGATCAAGDPAIQGNLYLISGGTVKFQSTATGTITLYCQIPANITAPSLIDLLYYDDDGTASAGNVKVSYVKMNKSTGVITTIQTANSDSGFVTSGGTPKTVTSPSIVDTYDDSTYVYYLRVDIARNTSTSDNQVFYYARLY